MFEESEAHERAGGARQAFRVEKRGSGQSPKVLDALFRLRALSFRQRRASEGLGGE